MQHYKDFLHSLGPEDFKKELADKGVETVEEYRAKREMDRRVLDEQYKQMYMQYVRQAQQIAKTPVAQQPYANPGRQILTVSYVCKKCDNRVEYHPSWEEHTGPIYAKAHECPTCVRGEQDEKLARLEQVLESR